MKNKYKALAVATAALMAFNTTATAVLAAPYVGDVEITQEEQAEGYSIFVSFVGNDVVSVMHDVVYGDAYQIKPFKGIEKEGYEFAGYYCQQNGIVYKNGDSIPISEFEQFDDGEGISYRIMLTAQFNKIQSDDSDVVYTEKAIYDAEIDIMNPADETIRIGSVSTQNVESVTDSVGQALAPRALTRGYGMYKLDGYRSLKTGKFFTAGAELKVEDLAEAVNGETTIDEDNALKITTYSIYDQLVPIFDFYGAVGTYQENKVNCEVVYYRSGEFTDAADLNAPVAYLGTENVTVAMADEADGVKLTAPEEAPGYIFVGYGPLDGTEPIYTDGVVALEDCVEWSNGNLRFAVKAFYEVDENYVPEEEPEVTPEEPEETPDIPDVPDVPVKPSCCDVIGQIITAKIQVMKTTLKTIEKVLTEIIFGFRR